jgi:hypothetical protein
MKDSKITCYKDMLFCQHWQGCREGDNCEKALTKEIINEAEESLQPVCVYSTYPDCFKLLILKNIKVNVKGKKIVVEGEIV